VKKYTGANDYETNMCCFGSVYAKKKKRKKEKACGYSFLASFFIGWKTNLHLDAL
jgi:hypothetical protein